MCAKPAEDSKKAETIDDRLWERMTEIIATRISRQCFETWFTPISFAGCNGEVCSLTVPTESFRRSLVDNYPGLLEEALRESTGRKLQLRIVAGQDDDGVSRLPVLRASALQSVEEQKPWLIERLWSAGAVGIVSGPPKALKTWTALEMAISVASGVPCLATFPVPRSGTVLLYAAEEPLPALHARLQALAQNHQRQLDDIDVRVIAVDSLRLDRPKDREKLTATVEFHRPMLLILDPLIRLHGLDENQSGPMA